jgi:FMN hydrolase / 5-amino-6-(5-phospho-D-ribitylamino)uracil phosphatase
VGSISTLSFDGDDCLWDFTTSMREALGEIRRLLTERRGGVAGPAFPVERMIAIRNDLAEAHPRWSLEKVRRASFHRVAELATGAPDPGLGDELTEIYFEHRKRRVELFPEVEAALEALHGQGYRIGLLTNAGGFPREFPVYRLFSFVVAAPDVGVSKPDPAIFEHTLRIAGCLREELLHVGDFLDTDIAGANRAGVRSVWLNRTGAPNPGPWRPDVTVQSLDELVQGLDAGLFLRTEPDQGEPDAVRF